MQAVCKKSILLIGFILTALSLFSQGDWKLVWSDEFNDPVINMDNWTFDIGGHGWWNKELQHYTDRPENARIENGSLIIEARKENYGGNEYTSARLKSIGKKYWKYGKVEARLKLPYGQGVWPALWMMGENYHTVSWPKCGEIDIMEIIGGGEGRDNLAWGSMHWDNNGTKYQSGTYKLPSGIFADAYHIFSIEWDEEKIQWFVDGIKYNEVSIKDNINGTEEFHKEFFLLVNLAIGGEWPGNPDSSTVFPQQYCIDYIRVYQKPAPVNIALGKTVGSSSEFSVDFPATAAVDGDMSTVWGSSDTNKTDWIYVDLGSVQEVNGVGFHWFGEFYPSEYGVFMSNDAVTWVKLGTLKKYKAGADIFNEGISLQCRYFGILCTKKNMSAVGLAELELFQQQR